MAVEREVERRRSEGDPQSDQEKDLLEKLGKEAGQWVEQAMILMSEVMENRPGEPDNDGSPKVSDSVSCDNHVTLMWCQVTSKEEDELPREVFVMGRDLNLHSRSLVEVVSKASCLPSLPPSLPPASFTGTPARPTLPLRTRPSL